MNPQSFLFSNERTKKDKRMVLHGGEKKAANIALSQENVRVGVKAAHGICPPLSNLTHHGLLDPTLEPEMFDRQRSPVVT